jgi:hypothetical protein
MIAMNNFSDNCISYKRERELKIRWLNISKNKNYFQICPKSLLLNTWNLEIQEKGSRK